MGTVFEDTVYLSKYEDCLLGIVSKYSFQIRIGNFYNYKVFIQYSISCIRINLYRHLLEFIQIHIQFVCDSLKICLSRYEDCLLGIVSKYSFQIRIGNFYNYKVFIQYSISCIRINLYRHLLEFIQIHIQFVQYVIR